MRDHHHHQALVLSLLLVVVHRRWVTALVPLIVPSTLFCAMTTIISSYEHCFSTYGCPKQLLEF